MSENYCRILIPSLLAPSVRIFSVLSAAQEIVVDVHETYPKQTLRNRYYIGSPNDVRALIVPVRKPYGHRTKTIEIEIDYSENWPLYHRKSLTTAYSKSPFFLYYADYIFTEFERKHDSLIDLNSALQSLFMKWLHIQTPVILTEDYIRKFDGTDLRNACKDNSAWQIRNEYYQPFGETYGFRNSLSVLDILFNLGPEAERHIKKEISYANIQGC